ncbi:MAG: chromosome segregation protein SMC, partial [Clostridiales bacterium]|nr:chromosome segregation protein SMC [Clostridiales bacterium]
MHLKKIEIQGFKSFPEHTLIEFDKGMTAIVGPNGSGKSNVTDAVRWVLGEQSVRTLRGGKMEDVIFNGTQSRRAMNFAEVSITIDNSDRLLDIDYSEVQVTRRLYRSGESEYQINHVNCRLKDIVRLFMDTGLGRDGYSIVGQGRIDDILSTRSEDRRKVLEEASGIVKFKARKEEAERKLLSAEQNLIRISDILGELSEQIEPLKDQAEKAKLYHRTYDEWKELDIGLTLHLIDRNQAFLTTSDEEFSRIEDGIREQEDAILRLRDKNRVLTEKSSNIEKQLDDLREKKSSLTFKIHEVSSELAVIVDRRKQLSERMTSGKDDDENARIEMDRLEASLNEQDKKVAELRAQKSKYDSALHDKEDEMNLLLSTLDRSIAEINDAKSKMETLSAEIFDYREQMQSLGSELMLFDSRIKSLSDERVILISEKDRNTAVLDDAETRSRTISAELTEAKNNYDRVQDELDAIRVKSEAHRTQIEQKQREKDNVSFRINTLRELESSKEGYQEPVRRLVTDSKKDTDLSRKMVGILGDLVQVPKEYETAIEISLGQSIHHVVTQSEKDAKELIEYLKQKKHGRATFLPIRTIRERSLDDRQLKTAKSGKGFIGIASDLISYDDSLKGIVGNILGRIVIVDSLDHAMAIAQSSGFSFRIVTIEGDVVNPGGSLTGGSIRRQGTGILGRSRELDELKERVARIEKDIAKMNKIALEQDRSSKDIARQSRNLDDRIRELSIVKAKAESETTYITSEISRLENRLLTVEKELETNSSKRILVQNDYEELNQSIKEHDKELQIIRSTLDRSDSDHKDVQKQLDDMRSDVSDLRISAKSIGVSLSGALEINDMLIREKEGFSDGLKKLVLEREQAESEIIKLAKDEEEKESIREKLLNDENEIKELISKLIIDKEEIEQQLSGFIDRLSNSTSRLSQFQT